MATYKKSKEMREKILEATAHLVVTCGYQQTNIKEIASYLDIPRTLVYYYFKNKVSILNELFNVAYDNLERYIREVIPHGEKPLIRLMVRYILFFRTIAWNPLFTEYLVYDVDYPSVGRKSASDWKNNYYAESIELFHDYNMPLDGNEFPAHVLMTEVVWRGLVVGIYFKTIQFNEYEILKYCGERTIMVTFDLGREEFLRILDEAFQLADQIKLQVPVWPIPGS